MCDVELFFGVQCGRTYGTASCNFILMCHFAFQINTLQFYNGRTSIFVVGLMMCGTGAVLSPDKQRVRLYCQQRVIDQIWLTVLLIGVRLIMRPSLYMHHVEACY